MRGVELNRVLVAVSGGKDSIALLDVLAWYSQLRGFEIIGVHVDLSIPGYSGLARRAVIDAFNLLGVEYVIVDPREILGVNTRMAHEAYQKHIIPRPTCSVCGMIKRRSLETVAASLGADAIATGHTFDDAFAFSLQNVVSGYSESFAVVEEGSGFIRLKPLLVVRESDTLAYVLARRLPFNETPCPYKPRTSATTRYKLVAGLLSEVNQGLASSIAGLKYRVREPRVAGRCVYCGSASRDAICSSCRTFSQILRGLGKS